MRQEDPEASLDYIVRHCFKKRVSRSQSQILKFGFQKIFEIFVPSFSSLNQIKNQLKAIPAD
jgi:hypothetical protein